MLTGTTSSAYFVALTEAVDKLAAHPDDSALLQLISLRTHIDTAAIPTAVKARRAEGDTWETIGAELGMTRQGAHQRFGQQERGGHWVRLENDGRAHCRQCTWVSTATGAAAVDQGAKHSADSE